MKNLGIVGLGKLGLPLASVFAKHFKVQGVDVSAKRIQQILDRKELFEPYLKDYLRAYSENLTFSLSYESLSECNIVFIITQTPSLPNGKFDLQYVESALKKLHEVCPSCLAVISSTTNIGDCDKLRSIHKRIVYNPEFIKQGSIIRDFEDPKFVLIGAYEDKDAKMLIDIWRKVLKIKHYPFQYDIYVVEPIEAEITKLSLNVSFTLAITFANAIGELCKNFGAIQKEVLDIIYKDRRNYYAGLGFMGPCFPRDVKCFRGIALENNLHLPSELSKLLEESNNYLITKYVEEIKSYGKKKIGFWGVSYKPNVPYIYESQPIKIAQNLLNEGYEIYVFDKLAEENAKKVLQHPKAHFCSSWKELKENVEVLFIGTNNRSEYENHCEGIPIVNPWR